MAQNAHQHNLWLSELEAPLLDLSGGDWAQLLLDRLRTQNFALDRLREELACEDSLSVDELCVAGGA